MKKLRLTALLLTSIICSGCNFFEIEDESSLDNMPHLSVTSETNSIDVDSLLNSLPQDNHQVDCSKFPKIIDTFQTKGLDGKSYDQSMFAGKLTLLNMWGTYCGPCVEEMPYLARCHKKYEEADFQVVGVVTDITDRNGNVVSSYKTRADNIVRNAGVTYTSLLPCAGLSDFLNSTEYIPYSVFIDEHGHQLGESITGGMDYSSWDKLIKNMMYTYMY